ncbi:dihydrodipicolinate synthase family protein [Agromyces aerolatus]|uniref:dihydrodipicolinate synthase family protein n=1 Tax=Agromyces sp. LY-1074 TaxID=3074080 RepID=UPI002855A4A6|nr:MULTISPECIES: dihydrodipicolinate synthase family protein [unclassified Agromyces]MDR5699041.1 dihydrodipicolinate synthase family protein [Agromyces sp. LY-1074]MDR5705181.1 dihydrodipicolinate synthase family protein [Agromyces sp. LY-1358]
MNRHDVDWSGYWPAAPTPFHPDGRLDEQGLAELIRLYRSHGVHGVLVNGSTGEWFAQSTSERHRVAEIAVEAAEGAFPVVVGVTAYTGAEAAELARHAHSVGADGVLATPPPYVHPSADEVVEFYRALGDATPLPVMVYNWPRGVSVDLAQSAGLMSRLAALPQVVAIKDSTGDWNAMVNTVQAVSSEVRVFGALTSRKGLAVMLGLGGDGAIDGGGVGAPYAVPFFDAVREGNAELARFWVDKYAAVSGRMINPDYSGRFASPIAQLKAAMRLLEQPSGPVREPLLDVSDPDRLTAIAGVLLDGGLHVRAGRLAELIEEGARP